MQERDSAYLLLEDGRRFEGVALGKKGVAVGEVVFHTFASNPHQLLTTPAFCGQLLAFTTPLVGNCGVNFSDLQSESVQAAGLIVRECCQIPSNFRNEMPLPDFLLENHVVGIEGVDTRALTKHLRTHGSLRGAIVSSPADVSQLLNELRRPAAPLSRPAGATPPPPTGNEKYHVVVVDLGCCKALLDRLRQLSCRITMVSPELPAQELLTLSPDGVLFSDGPETLTPSPASLVLAKDLLQSDLPLLGVDAGHQLLAVAAGCSLIPLPVGHRGPNQPVTALDGSSTFTTSQYHGLAVDGSTVDPVRARILCVSRNDGSVEALSYRDGQALSIQYLPGVVPDSTGRLTELERFCSAMDQRKEAVRHA
ncbi:MAG: carbamoyl phosphate synthase small subunit [Clostridia bacterium]|nr:carbamoyl phosphate synthase small subunit [Clostridia bacterium]